MSNRDPEVQAALDRQAIAEVLTRYCRGIDRLDRKALESVYWPDATDDHVTYKGDAPGFIDWVLDYLKPMKTQHFIGNMLIEIDSPTRAHAETYVNAYHQIKTHFSSEEMVAGARYIDRLEKRGNEWRLIDRVVCIDYSRRTPATEIARYDNVKNKGGRHPDDPVYRVFA